MGIEENKALVRHIFELYNQHDVDAVDELLLPSCFGGDSGWEQNKQIDIMLVNAFPDLKITILDMIAEGDKVAFIVSVKGTHTGGPYLGIPPTGKKAEGINTRIARIADNKFVEWNGTTDLFNPLRQLGVIPTIPEIVQAYKDSLE